MPLDPSFVPALEEELWCAERTKPGGQPPDPARIAAIKAQIKLHGAAKPVEADPGDASNESTDYESHDAKPEKVKRARAADKPERAVDEPETETADA